MQLRVFLALFPVVLALVSPARAQQLADGATLDRILPDIRAAHPGRLSDAQPWIDENGRTHYRIKWMTPEGRIIYFDADTRTGRYSSSNAAGEDRMRPPPPDRPRDNADSRPPPDDRGRRHDNWNGDLGPYGDDGQGPRGDGRGPDSRGPDGRGPTGRPGDPRGGDWRGNGDWRGGRGESDNGGGRHHGHGGF